MSTPFGRKRFVRNLPANVRALDTAHFQKIQSYDCPALRVYHFKSINLLPDSTLFKIMFPLSVSFLFFKKRIKHHNVKGILTILLTWSKKKISAGTPFVVIHDGWTKNYYHWTTQALPRLILAQQTNKPFVLLLPDDHQTEFHISSLNLLQVNTWQTIEAKAHVYYAITNLLYPTHDIQIGDYNDDLILMLREKLTRKTYSKEPGKKIFIRRLSQEGRRILNEQDVIDVFLSYQFEIVSFETLSFEDQITLMGRTAVLAGVHGAGLVNMLFMPLNSIVFELTTSIDGESYYYYALSNTLSHKYYYQVCDRDQDITIQQANFLVDIEKLKENLTMIVS
jgi:capsular polysaccharide biosynthesis protein